MRAILWTSLLLLAGCPQTRIDLVGVDADGDGYGSWLDCDDDDADRSPGATEVPYNGVDDDCDASTPDDDLDGDTYAQADDCDDTDASTHPGATEVCDGKDNDCAGGIDDGLLSTWYADTDGDGFGDPLVDDQRCEAGGGAWVRNDLDCDDEDEAVFPGAREECDDIDNDCDGITDTDAIVRPTWYRDLDEDLFGDPQDSLVACDKPEGYVANADDCDDDASTGGDVHPGADETCNGVDDDCDGYVDNNDPTGSTTFYLDADGDTQGTELVTWEACSNPDPTWWVTNDLDCDDSSDQALDGGTEVCDGLDNDCDGTVDVGASDAFVWYADLDEDGFGDPDNTTDRCDDGGGVWVLDDSDCDDNATDGDLSFPGNPEICDDGRDNDCNGIDDDAPSAGLWFLDDDGDGYGDPTAALAACEDPSDVTFDYVQNSEDCDDGDALIKPGGTETCDGVDEDCDGLVDDGAAPLLDWWIDVDGDGQGDEDATAVQACSVPAVGYVTNDDDCDDADDTIYTGAGLQCGRVDANCDGLFDFDGDGDLYVDRSQCADGLDCDDGSSSVKPGAGCAWGRSCLEALANNPGFAGTDQSVDLDPLWDENNVSRWCDFTDDDIYGPGWTLVYWADFEDASQTTGWGYWDFAADQAADAHAVRTSCDGDNILGGFNETSEGWLHRAIDSVQIPHEEIVVDFEYWQIDSWDGELGFLRLERNAGLSAGAWGIDGYQLWAAVVSRGGTNLCGSPDHADWFDHHFLVTQHTWDDENFFRLEFGSFLDQPADDESFGIDDVYVWIR